MRPLRIASVGSARPPADAGDFSGARAGVKGFRGLGVWGFRGLGVWGFGGLGV